MAEEFFINTARHWNSVALLHAISFPRLIVLVKSVIDKQINIYLGFLHLSKWAEINLFVLDFNHYR